MSGLHHTPQHTISSDKANRGISQIFVADDGSIEQEDRMLCLGTKKMPEGFVTMRTQLGRNVVQSVEPKTSPQMVSMAETGS